MRKIYIYFLLFLLSLHGLAQKHSAAFTVPGGFIENKGQLIDQNGNPNPGVKYLLNSPGFNVQLRQSGFSYDTYTDISDASAPVAPTPKFKNETLDNTVRKFHRVDVELLNCNTHAELLASGASKAYFNYFTPGTPEGGVNNVHYYNEVIYKNIYPNIDLQFMASTENRNETKPSPGVEYNFIVHPGGKISDIQLAYKGAFDVNLKQNKIVVQVASGTFNENIPSSYLKDTKQEIKINYVALEKNTFGFSSAERNQRFSSDLIIDPTPDLVWGTYYGGGPAGTTASYDIVLDATGNIYITGDASTPNGVATTGAYMSTSTAAAGYNNNAFAAKFDPTGTTLIWGTYYGGNGPDWGYGIAVDASNNVYIAGNTWSTTGIATPGAAKTVAQGTEAFVAKFNSTGSSLLWGTYYGGESNDGARALAIDASGNAFITGTTSSTTGIATAGAYKTSYNSHQDVFVAEISSTGNALLWGSYYGGTGDDEGFDIAVARDGSGNVYITGTTTGADGISTPGAYQGAHAGVYPSDAFVAEFSSNGSFLLWGTYYGGPFLDVSYGMDLDANDNVYITGWTESLTGIATAGAYQTTYSGGNPGDILLAKFNPTGTTLLWATYYGSTDYDYGQDVAVAADGNIFLTGMTGSTSGVVAANAYQNTMAGVFDVIVAGFDPTGTSLLWSTYYGGNDDDRGYGIAVDKCDNVFVTGYSQSSSGMGSAGAYQVSNASGNAFIGKFTAFAVNIVPAGAIPFCAGGSVSLTANGASTYSWTPATGLSSTSGATVTASPLSSQTYTVTGTSVAGCTTTQTIAVTVNPVATVTATPITAGCGVNNGSAVANASGGTGTLTYSWSNLANGQTISGVAAGSYTVSVTDNSSCQSTTTVLINNSPSPTITNISSNGFTCNGQSQGQAVATATGGTGALTYTWSNTLSGTTVSGLAGGTYTITVKDANGCLTQSTVVITELTPITTSTVVVTDASCGTPGSASVTVAGGTIDYTYIWSNAPTSAQISSSSTTSKSNLGAGTYSVTTTDNNSCTNVTTLTIGSTGGVTVNSTISTAIKCNGETGAVTATASSGTSPYTYSWSNGTSSITNSTQSTITNQLSSIYTVTITDANGCTSSSTVNLTQATAVSITNINSVNAACGTATGSATATAIGGTGGLTYSWSNFISGQTITGLNAGTYILTVTDANECSNTQSVLISNSPAPTINSITTTSVLCNGGSTGSASVNISGSFSPFTYNWSTGSTATTTNTQSTANNLKAATYTVTVTDANGCQQISVTTIVQPTAVSITSVNTTSANCNKSDGSAVANANGGTGTLTYNWFSASGTTSGTTASGLAAGNYTLIVTDANGCTLSNALTINSTNAPTVTASVTSSIKCNGQTGSVSATASSGTSPYTYSWSVASSGSGSAISNVVAGNYTVTITDNIGCTSSSVITLSEPTIITINQVKTDAACGKDNGSILASVTGGTANYTYNWSNDSTKSAITNLQPGTYFLTLTDANGCTTTTSSTIANSAGPVAGVSSSQTTITEGNSTVLLASGGTIYSWTPSSSLNCSNCASPTANPETTTTYTVYVKDNNGCVDSATIAIDVKKACSNGNDIFIANVFSPNGDGQNDVLNIEGNAVSNIYWAIYDRWGNIVFSTTDLTQGWDGTKNGNTLESGTYVYYLKAVCSKTNSEVRLKGNVSVVK